MSEPLSPDPVEAAFQQARGYVDYHRDINDPVRAEAMSWALTFVEEAVRAVATMAVTYEVGAAVSIWEIGTIKNKISAGEIPGGNGNVALAALPICPKKAPTLHAIAGISRINDVKGEKAIVASKEVARKATARARVDAIRARRSAASA